jgi:hypothetical protein
MELKALVPGVDEGKVTPDPIGSHGIVLRFDPVACHRASVTAKAGVDALFVD